mmetsp:Transcript_22227/g.54693  ORF Transcript_22227/g.54693 Transcript_22227/m.54693 type:complete len:265 (+) Transcript_22227:1041-1835(+)
MVHTCTRDEQGLAVHTRPSHPVRAEKCPVPIHPPQASTHRRVAFATSSLSVCLSLLRDSKLIINSCIIRNGWLACTHRDGQKAHTDKPTHTDKQQPRSAATPSHQSITLRYPPHTRSSTIHPSISHHPSALAASQELSGRPVATVHGVWLHSKYLLLHAPDHGRPQHTTPCRRDVQRVGERCVVGRLVSIPFGIGDVGFPVLDTHFCEVADGRDGDAPGAECGVARVVVVAVLLLPPVVQLVDERVVHVEQGIVGRRERVQLAA